MNLVSVFIITLVHGAGPRPRSIEDVAWRLRARNLPHSDLPETRFHMLGYEDSRRSSDDSGDEGPKRLSMEETERVIFDLYQRNPSWGPERIAQRFSNMYPLESMDKGKAVRIRQRYELRTMSGGLSETTERSLWRSMPSDKRDALLKRLHEITVEEVNRNGGRHADSVIVKGKVLARFHQEFGFNVLSWYLSRAFSTARSMAQ